MKLVSNGLKKALSALFLYPVYLLCFLIPRRRNAWVFGSHNNSFADNSKYLFWHVVTRHPEIQATWVSGSKALVSRLRAKGYDAHYRWSLGGLLAQLRSKVFVYSSYPSDINFWTSGGATLLNLWHGVPLKRIENDIKTGKLARQYNSRLTPLYRLLAPNYFARPHHLVSTAPAISDILSGAFKVDRSRCLDYGFPRTDVFFFDDEHVAQFLEQEDPAIVDVLRKMKEYARVFIYMPTFRERGSNDLATILRLEHLNEVLRQQGSLLLVKQHANVPTSSRGTYSNILFLPNGVDVYPLLKHTAALVTDYSSIFFDYMLLGKPILFFAYDKEAYLNSERGFYFDYDTYVPGPICETYDALVAQLQQVAGEPTYAARRAEVWGAYRGGASERIVAHVMGGSKGAPQPAAVHEEPARAAQGRR